MVERLKLQDEILNTIEEGYYSEEEIVNKFKSTTLTKKSIDLTLNYLVESGYLDKRKSNIDSGFRYSLTLAGKDKITYSFTQEYLDIEIDKNLNRDSTETSIILNREQIKQISSTKRIAWISLIVNIILALKILFFDNGHDSHKNYTEGCNKKAKRGTDVKDSLRIKAIK